MSDDPVDRARLREALQRLAPLERHIYWLGAVEGLQNDQIAARLRISPAKVECLLAHAIVELDRQLDR